jgi:protein arginine N-methyltransferase 1
LSSRIPPTPACLNTPTFSSAIRSTISFEAGLIETVADVRARLLKPGGRIIPERVTMYLAPVEAPAVRDHLTFWARNPVGFSFGPARDVAVNSGHRVRIELDQLLGRGGPGAVIDLQTITDAPFDCGATLAVSRDGMLNGIGGWFGADLAGGVAMTNAPGDVNRINRSNVVFPIDEALPLRAGDTLNVSMRIRPADLLVKWTVESGGRRFSHSTLAGMLIPREDLERTRPSFTPRLTDRGVARRTVLELCDGRPLGAIEREVFERHRDLFDSEAAAHVFVAEVVTRYCV